MSIKKKWIGNDQIDGSKIRLLNEQALSGNAADGSEVDILKIDSSDKLQLLLPAEVSADPVGDNELTRKSYVDAAIDAATIEIAQSVYVTADGSDATGDGSLAKPFATISGAMAAITDASPSKRYAIQVAPGNYTEVSGLALKANVFVIGADLRLVRITGAVSLDSSFSGSADNRAGFSRVSLLSAVNFDWAAVTSAAGKIYCREVLFSSTLNLNGHNNAIAQALFDQCQMFGATTISGINVGTYVDNWHWDSLSLNQHPNGGMATILNAVGCRFSGITATASVDNFGRRCSLFLNSCFVDSLTVDGPSAYADMTNDSVPRLGATSANGGNLVYISPVSPGGVNPDQNNARYIGDFGKQWFFNFAYVHASTGTDLYLTSTAASYGTDSVGRSIYIQPDGYGLDADVDGGDIILETAAVSGTGIRGKVDVLARVIEVNDAQIKELADGTDASDAVNKGQLDLKLDASEVGVSVASLVGGVVPVDQLPAIAITDTFVVADEAAMLALVAETGDVAIREDLSKSFILAAEPPSTLDNWKELLTPADTVLSVNGQTGIVSLDSDDVAEGTANLYFTEERAKQAAAAQQKHERIVLSATDITNGYIDLQNDVIGVPMVFNGPSRIPLLPTDDFSVSGARITWNPATVGQGGEEALVEDEIIHVFYMG
jgi:hypothetical protein